MSNKFSVKKEDMKTLKYKEKGSYSREKYDLTDTQSLQFINELHNVLIKCSEDKSGKFDPDACKVILNLGDKDTRGFVISYLDGDFYVTTCKRKSNKYAKMQHFTYEDILIGLKFKEKSYSRVYEFFSTDLRENFSASALDFLRGIGNLNNVFVTCVPIVSTNNLLAMIVFVSHENKSMTPSRKKLATILSGMIGSHYNKIYYPSDIDSMKGMIKSLTFAIEEKDEYTKGHSQRVSDISTSIATALNLHPYEVEEISFAGLLHDVGKIGISENILLKKEKLTDDEIELIKTHPIKTKKILSPLESLKVKNIINMSYSHHERFDGSGYPDRKSGAEIPLGARIITLADAFDAMTSKRVYRDTRMTKKEAVSEILRQKEKQFDPNVVDAFLKIEETIRVDKMGYVIMEDH